MHARFSTALAAAALAVGLFRPVSAASAASPPAPPAAPLPKADIKVDPSPVSEGRAGVITSYADVVEPVQRAVVTVHSTIILPAPLRMNPGTRQGFGGRAPRTEEGLGSGVIVSPNGYILTNNHVVADADKLTVTLNDGREFEARVIGTDEKTDIAVIKIEALGLPVLTLADSDRLRVGDIVFAVGNPLGVGQSVTMGIVSATGRTDLNLLDDVNGYGDFIQTDAAINMGNSGGALVDARGRLVGLNAAIMSPSEGNIGIGFSIPVNLVRGIMENILQNGKVQRGYLGVGSVTLTPDDAGTLGLNKETKGVKVERVPADGPAALAGLKANDVIVAIGSHPIASLAELRLTVAQLAPGTEVSVKLLRDGKEQTLKATLAKLDETVDTSHDLLPGVVVAGLDAESRRQLGFDSSTAGLLITDVRSNSHYTRSLAPGLVILQINGVDCPDLEAARKLLKPGTANDLLLGYVSRSGLQKLTLTLPLPAAP